MKRNIDHSVQAYTSDGEGLRIETSDIEEHLSNIKTYERILEDKFVFKEEKYLEGRAPFPLPHIDLTALINEYPRCLDMPLRLSGKTQYSLPKEWLGLANIVKELIAIETKHNLNWKDYNTYLTVDCSQVEVNAQQRHGGLHVDGFQGMRIYPKTKVTRNYVMTINGGTRFYPQAFIVVDPAKFNVFQGFDLQAGEPVVAEENCAYFMDAYCVHESGFASRNGLRTFLRLTFDLKPFDRLGNTHNSMLDYNWDMVARTTQEGAVTPRIQDVLVVAGESETVKKVRRELL